VAGGLPWRAGVTGGGESRSQLGCRSRAATTTAATLAPAAVPAAGGASRPAAAVRGAFTAAPPPGRRGRARAAPPRRRCRRRPDQVGLLRRRVGRQARCQAAAARTTSFVAGWGRAAARGAGRPRARVFGVGGGLCWGWMVGCHGVAARPAVVRVAPYCGLPSPRRRHHHSCDVGVGGRAGRGGSAEPRGGGARSARGRATTGAALACPRRRHRAAAVADGRAKRGLGSGVAAIRRAARRRRKRRHCWWRGGAGRRHTPGVGACAVRVVSGGVLFSCAIGSECA